MKLKAIVEIPKDSYNKYEVKNGHLKLDRILDIPCPENYGFIPNTLAEDGDPLDVFIINNIALPPLTEVEVEIIGVLKCMDQGIIDNKLIAIMNDFLMYNDDMLEDIIYYLTNYKTGFEVLDFDMPFSQEELKKYVLTERS